MVGEFRKYLACVVVISLLVCSFALLKAQPAQTPMTVVDVRVEGNSRLSNNAVLAHVRTRIGEAFDPAIVSQDQRRLLQTGQFNSVQASMTPTAEGAVITFEVIEKPVIKALRIEGNKAISTKKLTKELAFSTGDPLDQHRVETGRQAIESAYRDKLYTHAEVTVDQQALDSDEVVYVVREGPKISIRSIKFKGNESFSDLRLKFKISTKQRFWPFISGKLDFDQLDDDTVALQSFYTSEGFLDAEIDRTVNFSDNGKTAKVTFVIREGPRYRVNQVLFRGNTVFSDVELAGRIRLKMGEFYIVDILRRDITALQNAYGSIGFINVSVQSSRAYAGPPGEDLAEPARPIDQPAALVDVTFEVDEGQQFQVGSIEIRGHDITQERVIRRHIRIFPEQLFNTEAVEESRKRLLETRLFDEVTINPTGSAEGFRDALVQVTEAKTTELLFGVGVSTNSGVIGTISLTQRNFDIFGWPDSTRQLFRGQAFRGAGQTLSLVAQPGTELSEFSVEWTDPYLLDQPYSLSVRGFLFERGRDSYDEHRVGAMTSLGHRFTNKWYVELAQRIENVRIDDLDHDAPPEVRKVAGDNLLLGTKLTVVRDRTDSRWIPTTGDRFRVSYEQVYGDHTFGKAMADYSIYRTVHTDALDRKHVWANRFTAGNIIGSAPIFERLYAGGAGSVRGFGYRGISPRSLVNDDPVGGDLLLLAGSEYEFPLIGNQIRGAVFIDTGTVEEDFEITSYRVSAGVGVRWIVPLLGPVPMSFDLGFPLAKHKDDDTQIFSFSIGITF